MPDAAGHGGGVIRAGVEQELDANCSIALCGLGPPAGWGRVMPPSSIPGGREIGGEHVARHGLRVVPPERRTR